LLCSFANTWGLTFHFSRQWLARIIPRSLTLATGAGIGLFIALIGLGSAGLGVVGGDYTNLVGLGGCTAECEYLLFFTISVFSPGSNSAMFHVPPCSRGFLVFGGLLQVHRGYSKSKCCHSSPLSN
jgi:xanthine/uracil/vitamin C permease (AzgA family)